ncbi:MAG: outer membrane protein assembly factor BamE [Rhodospirillales bacterium]|nr:outer membrane protein assembly factor BamE [Alphaproteobacteria bacterium]MCB9987175.1 outer membrane protein assembly factor BamE [Rhodospirillales bacterium]USO07961.1 MAG: outer membrane protein assembly factor BamE [Rhodospirillales bacterium]
MKNTHPILLAVACAALALGACTPVRATNGIYLTEEDIAHVPAGASRADVLQALGTPTTTAMFDDSIWYYIGQKTEKTAFLDPKTTDRTVYEVKFAQDGTMTSLQKLDAKPVDVPLVRSITPTSGHDLTAAQQLLGNLGRFNKSKKLKATDTNI